MSLALLLPMALAALAALALPLLVHLVRRTEEKPVLFAALRWLRAADAPRQRRRFDEWLLLLLRLLLLALLALWLAQPVLQGHRDLRPWLLVVPGADPALAPAMDEDTQRRWLAPGLPALDAPMPRDAASLASLLREADAGIPPEAPVTVLVPERIVRTDAQRPRLSRELDWRVVPGVQAGDGAANPPLQVAVRSDAAHADALRYLRAAHLAWSAQARTARQPVPTLDAQATDAPLAREATHALWLSSAAVPAAVLDWTRAGGTLLLANEAPLDGIDMGDADVAWRGGDGQPLAQATMLGHGRVLRMLLPWTPASMPLLLEPDFPQALRTALDDAAPVATHAFAAVWAPLTGAMGHEPEPLPLQPWLALLLALLLGIERIVAMRAGRQVPA